MTNLTEVNGLWVPTADAERFRAYPWFDGLPTKEGLKTASAMSFASPHGTALDIGAHIGVTAITMARYFDQVVAFEASPDNYAALARNTQAWEDKIDAVCCAISDKAGKVQFEVKDDHTQLNRIIQDRLVLPESHAIEVEARTIDSFKFSRVKFIKIDTEGHELQVLEGAIDTICYARPVILLEQAGNEAKYNGRTRNEASEFLESLGMERVEGLPFKKDRVYR